MKQGPFWEAKSYLYFGYSSESVWFRIVAENFIIHIWLVFRLDNIWVPVLKITPPSPPPEKNIVLVFGDSVNFSFFECDKMSVNSGLNYLSNKLDWCNFSVLGYIYRLPNPKNINRGLLIFKYRILYSD